MRTTVVVASAVMMGVLAVAVSLFWEASPPDLALKSATTEPEDETGCGTHDVVEHEATPPDERAGLEVSEQAAVDAERARAEEEAVSRAERPGRSDLRHAVAAARAERLRGVVPKGRTAAEGGGARAVWEATEGGLVVARVELEAPLGEERGWRVAATSVRLPDELCEMLERQHELRLELERTQRVTGDGG